VFCREGTDNPRSSATAGWYTFARYLPCTLPSVNGWYIIARKVTLAEQLPNGDQITLRQLLSHTSGVVDFGTHPAYWNYLMENVQIDEAGQTAALACEQHDPNAILARYVYDQNAEFEPGARFSWSSTGFILLGMVMETATGESVADLYRARIFEPLGMTETFFDCYEEPTVSVVHGYDMYLRNDGNLYDVTEAHESMGWTAGGIVSTAPDLIRFARGLFSGALFSDSASLDEMKTGQPNRPYGLGMMIFRSSRYGHEGGILGYTSLLQYFAERDTVLVILYNADNTSPATIAPTVWTILDPVFED
jgi:D-alanyl-D-alanine carboxypeptidase